MGNGIVAKVTFSLKMPENMRNGFNRTSGAAISCLLDDVTWLGAFMVTGIEMYSVKLILEFMNATPFNEDLILEVYANKVSKNLAFMEATIKDAKTKTLLSQGSNIMAAPPEDKPRL